VEARKLVADAALGVVDSVDLLGPNHAEGTTLLYHHLLSCGLRLAATAGTDVWLSFSTGPLISDPRGWARVYADLRGAPLSVAAFQEAIRVGRTLATTGPWIEISAAGCGPGDVVTAEAGTAVAVRVTCTGLGVENLQLVGPDGVLAESDGSAIETTWTPRRPCGWLPWPAGLPTRRCRVQRCPPTPAPCTSRCSDGP
jgi:hypothetical protein